ncbi:hypothetical protein BJV77DRAFT_961736 [Russula vinacea]|nr:hypothetical protein BJV77DRAFT_961736 [Russula vinacea]
MSSLRESGEDMVLENCLSPPLGTPSGDAVALRGKQEPHPVDLVKATEASVPRTSRYSLSWPNRQVELLKVEQGTWERRERGHGHGQHVILELLDKHGLHNSCLVAGPCEVVARERAFSAKRGEVMRCVVSSRWPSRASPDEDECFRITPTARKCSPSRPGLLSYQKK